MKFLTIIGSYIKTHIITTAVVGTVVVGGVVATPVVLNNLNNTEPEIKTEIPQEEDQELTCADGFELVNGNCTEIETEEIVESDENNEIETKQENKTESKTTSNKPNQNNNTSKPQENKPQENKPTCNDISCKITESNRVVYYEGKMLFGIKVFQPYGYDVDGWQYNSSLIQSLSKEDRNYVFNNYFKKSTYCSTGHGTATDCLRYSAFEKRLDEIIKTSNDEIYQYSQNTKFITPCIAYIQNGTIPEGYDKETMDGICHQEDRLSFKWTVEDVQHSLNEDARLTKLHTNVINESQGYKTAYQTTRSLLQQ